LLQRGASLFIVPTFDQRLRRRISGKSRGDNGRQKNQTAASAAEHTFYFACFVHFEAHFRRSAASMALRSHKLFMGVCHKPWTGCKPLFAVVVHLNSREKSITNLYKQTVIPSSRQ